MQSASGRGFLVLHDLRLKYLIISKEDEYTGRSSTMTCSPHFTRRIEETDLKLSAPIQREELG